MPTDIEALKPIATKGVDLGKFEGQRVKIGSADVMTVRSKFANNAAGGRDNITVLVVDCKGPTSDVHEF